MSLFVELLRGEEEALGPAFVSYSRSDAKVVRDVIETNLTHHGLPYFLDVKDIHGGSKPVDEVEKAVRRACVGVLVLSPQSIESRWVWFEAGLFVGFNRTVLPFVVNTAEPATLIEKLPEFIRRYQILQNVDELVGAVQRAQCSFYDLFEDFESNRRVVMSLRQVRLSLTLVFPKELRLVVAFGVLLVRFGREEALHHPANVALAEDGRLINKPLKARGPQEDESSGEIEVKYVLPVHRKLGLQFKPFVDIGQPEQVSPVVKALQAGGCEDVRPSYSGTQQRIYFLLPEGQVSILQSPEGIPNNFIYPE